MKQPKGSRAAETGKSKSGKRRRGLPSETAVVAETTITSPKGGTYRVLKTTEKDPYDPEGSPRNRDRDGD